MDPAQLLRERERRLMAEYPATHPPTAFDGEDLQSVEPATVEHWVGLYTELVDFVHGIIESTRPAAATQAPGGEANGVPALELQARVLELHLAYWTERQARLGMEPGPGQS